MVKKTHILDQLTAYPLLNIRPCGSVCTAVVQKAKWWFWERLSGVPTTSTQAPLTSSALPYVWSLPASMADLASKQKHLGFSNVHFHIFHD